MYDYKAHIEKLKALKEEMEKSIELDLYAAEIHSVISERDSNLDTYRGWQVRGVNVRKGEKAHSINGENLFHFTQTTGFTV